MHDQVVHVIMLLPLLSRRIQVEARALPTSQLASCFFWPGHVPTRAEIILALLPFHSGPARTRVRANDGDPLFSGGDQEPALLTPGVLGACQSGKIEQHGYGAGVRGGGGDEDVELGGQGEGGRVERVLCQGAC